MNDVRRTQPDHALCQGARHRAGKIVRETTKSMAIAFKPIASGYPVSRTLYLLVAERSCWSMAASGMAISASAEIGCRKQMQLIGVKKSRQTKRVIEETLLR
jgi:hypothetical protein